jgi:hypothetical protein
MRLRRFVVVYFVSRYQGVTRKTTEFESRLLPGVHHLQRTKIGSSVPMKKTSVRAVPSMGGGLSKSKAGSRSPLESWHNGGDTEIFLYARSLHLAAKTLAGKLEADQNARTEWDVCPVVLLYREALEIHLKSLVGEGSNFLKKRTDPISLSGTHSLRWLAQIVCQIIRAVKWEGEFKCEGVSSLADFNALVNEVQTFDPVGRAIRSSRSGDPESVSQYYRSFNVVQFAKTLDALLNLLDSTADALAAEATAGEDFSGGNGFGPTIQ